MHCPRCGTEYPEESRFCDQCGGRLEPSGSATVQPRPAVPGAPRQTVAAEEKVAAGWFRTPAGIALVVIIGIAVLGGIALGVFFAVKGGGSSGLEELVEVWDDYQDIASEAEAAQAQVDMTPASLWDAQAEVEAAQAEVAELKDSLSETEVPKDQPEYLQLKEVLDLYEEYAGSLSKLYATLSDAVSNGTLEANKAGIDEQARETKDLLADLDEATETFLADNAAVGDKPEFKVEVATDTIDDLEAAIQKATTAETEARIAQEEARPYVEADGIYIASNGTSITLHADRTVEAINPDGRTSVGTYTISGNTITFVSEGITDVGTIENGVISAPDGRRWVKR